MRAHTDSARLTLAVSAALLAALTLTALAASEQLAALPSLRTLWSVGETPGMAAVLFLHSWLPRVAMAVLCGAGLGLAGAIMQQALDNPIAAPTTLGVATGAQLSLAVVSLLAPGLLTWGSEWIAFAGAALAAGLLFLLAWRRGLDPLTLILAGLVVSLYLGAINAALLLFNPHRLSALFIWGAGSLSQNGWGDVGFLLPRLLLAGAAAAFLLRPLGALDLGDASARSLGISTFRLRGLAFALAVLLTACVTSVVGIIGFIGLAAPALVRQLGGRTFGSRLLWSPIVGALLLLLTDQLVQQVAPAFSELLPTGAVTAALGAPLLLWLLTRLRLPTLTAGAVATAPSLRPARPALLLLALLLPGVALLAVLAGHGPEGWRIGGAAGLHSVLPWRLPRMLTALGAGVMLGVAGVVIQRIARNPMASPEILGISSGAGMAFVVVTLAVPGAGMAAELTSGTVGALAALLVLLALTRAAGYAPERLLLVGIAIKALLDASMALALAQGGPDATMLLNWMAGSTYTATAPQAWTALALAGGLLAAVLPLARWLELLTLGPAAAQALGLGVATARVILLLLAAVLTAAATLLIGPLSFVGLMAPHLATMLGLNRARAQLIGAALLGAVLMVTADWVGRNLLFPYEIPAGLTASILGGIYFMWLLARRP